MSSMIIAFPGNEILADSIRAGTNAEEGKIFIRHFPDGESYVRVLSEVASKDVIIVASLNSPDDKLLPLFFLCKKIKEEGARSLTLVAPYLAYMRQDKSFSSGEAVTSTYFASLLSFFLDRLITVDPHLHRHHAMKEIYSIPCIVLHASHHVSEWIKRNIEKPLLIGPDDESVQWVSKVANEANAEFIILEKERLGDNNVKVSVPNVEKYNHFTPVLVDDIISTGQTMVETLNHLKAETMLRQPVCIGVHAVFSDDAHQRLIDAGAARVITCNTIPHPSNQIDLSGLFVQSLISLQSGKVIS